MGTLLTRRSDVRSCASFRQIICDHDVCVSVTQSAHMNEEDHLSRVDLLTKRLQSLVDAVSSDSLEISIRSSLHSDNRLIVLVYRGHLTNLFSHTAITKKSVN